MRRQTIHIVDALAVAEATLPENRVALEREGIRTILGVPLLRGGTALGAIVLRRMVVRPFTDKQIELIQNFANQAVIAIENTRLLNELRQSLEQQTATADVLRVISASPGELEPVFGAMLENATRICEAKIGNLLLFDGKDMRIVAMHNAPREHEEMRRRNPVIPLERSIAGPLVKTKKVVYVADITAEEPYASSPLAKVGGARTAMAVPMLREDELVGAITIYREEVRPFTEKQIALVQNFAAQAVIAIENTRLLNELRQSLEQQTATADVLRVISASPGALEPVFEAMLANAVRICNARFGNLLLFDGRDMRMAAMHNAPHAYEEARRGDPVVPMNSIIGPLVATKKVVHIDDLAADQRFANSMLAKVAGARTALAVPMLRDNELVGAIAIYHQNVHPFTDKQVDLVSNFAAQAVIAIENTRLLNELRQRTADLTESLEQQTATSEVLRVISASPGELEPIFASILENATRICQANFGILTLREGDAWRIGAMHNTPLAFTELRQREPVFHPGPLTAVARAANTKQPLHILDAAEDVSYQERDPSAVIFVELAGVRTVLVVPMLKDNEVIGAFNIYRREVRPFTAKQIELMSNFAAQAVIAIENTRLLNELRQSLEQQTATADVLRVISSSRGELEPVFQSMLENAIRICDAKFGTLWRYDCDAFEAVALCGAPSELVEFHRQRGSFRPATGTGLDRVSRTKDVISIPDETAEPTQSVSARLAGARSLIVVPMLKESELIGAISIYRDEVRPFTDKQIDLVTNFAAQAVIAIENTRLLNELRQSLEQQTATADVLRVISASPGDAGAGVPGHAGECHAHLRGQIRHDVFP